MYLQQTMITSIRNVGRKNECYNVHATHITRSSKLPIPANRNSTGSSHPYHVVYRKVWAGGTVQSTSWLVYPSLLRSFWVKIQYTNPKTHQEKQKRFHSRTIFQSRLQPMSCAVVLCLSRLALRISQTSNFSGHINVTGEQVRLFFNDGVLYIRNSLEDCDVVYRDGHEMSAS